MTKQKPTRSGQTVVIVAIVVLVAIVLCVLLSRTMLQLNQTSSELTAMTADRDSTAQELSAAQSLLAETDASLTEAKAKLAETEGKLADTEAKLTETEGKLSETETKLTEVEAKLADTEAKLTETETALATSTAAQETAAAALVQSEAQLTACQTALTDTEAKLAETEGKLADTEAKLTDSETKLSDAETKLSETEDALTGARNALSETQTILAAMTAEKDAAAAALADRETALSDAQSALAAMTAEKEAAVAALANTTAERDAAVGGYEVVEELTWNEGSLRCLGLVIRNRSGEARAVSAVVKFLDEQGGVVAVSRPVQEVCDSDDVAFLSCSCGTAYAKVEYSIVLTETSTVSNTGDILMTVEITPKRVTITAENTGETLPDHIDYTCVFLDETGAVVRVAQGALEVPAPGASTSLELTPDTEFACAEVYYTAFTR